MRTNTRQFLTGLVLTVLAVVAWVVLRPQRQPAYGGRPVSYWLRHPTRTPATNFPVLGDVAISFPQMDSNAVPFLIKELERPDGLLESWHWGLCLKLSPRWRNHLPQPLFPGEVRANAASVLTKMGTNGRPAIPALIRTMKGDASGNARFSAATSLLSIGGGDAAVRAAFAEALNDKSQSSGVRIMAQCYLRPARPNVVGTPAPTNADFNMLFPDMLFPGIPLIPDGTSESNH